MNSPVSKPEPDITFFEEHKKVYPKKVSGTFRQIKWAILVLTLGVYYLLPFVRWNRGPNAPDQAVLVDMHHTRLYFFNIEIWPQEVYYLTGLLIAAALLLFMMNAIAGRLWCGYLCPQTVWTDLFMSVERFFEGDRRDRLALDNGKMTVSKFFKKLGKHFTWLMIAWWTGGAWVLYFNDAPTTVYELATFTAHWEIWMWIGILTASTYLFAGIAREQICIYMCPWPRIQAAFTDDEALNVTYRWDRGEPRGSVKTNKALLAEGKPAGDCIDCNQCYEVCPTGVDIRKGLQLDCIMCGLCIDACDSVMHKVGKPHGLIAYDTDLNIERRLKGEPEQYHPIRIRTVAYAIFIAAIMGGMAYSLMHRETFGLNVLHDRNPLYVKLSTGGIRNAYTVRLLNKERETKRFAIGIEGIEGITLKVIDIDNYKDGKAVVEVEPDRTREIRVLAFTPKGTKVGVSNPVTLTLTDLDTGIVSKTSDYFKGPRP